jgi:O-acetyl-ADP-ribose deacetylase (regulator of RNase III)
VVVIHGNLLETPFQIMAHQVNCQGIMGAGLAKSIREKYPDVYSMYKQFCTDNHNDKSLLGAAIGVATEDRHIIYNLFGQYIWGRDTQQTDYDAFQRSVIRMIYDIRYDGDDELTLYIAIPHRIGCGLAGGNWEIIKRILEEIEEKYNVIFIAYKYKYGKDE